MWIKRASRGRLFRPLSWSEVSGMVGLDMSIGAGCVGAGPGWEGGDAEGWPLG